MQEVNIDFSSYGWKGNCILLKYQEIQQVSDIIFSPSQFTLPQKSEWQTKLLSQNVYTYYTSFQITATPSPNIQNIQLSWSFVAKGFLEYPGVEPRNGQWDDVSDIITITPSTDGRTATIYIEGRTTSSMPIIGTQYRSVGLTNAAPFVITVSTSDGFAEDYVITVPWHEFAYA